MQINRQTMKVIEEEFPWLSPLVQVLRGTFNVRVMDLDTLNLSTSGESSQIYLISRDGHVIGQVGQRTIKVKARWMVGLILKMLGRPTTWTEKQYAEETVEEALDRFLPASRSLGFVLYATWREVNLYKVKGNLEDHLDRKREEAKKKLHDFVEKF